MPTCTFTASPLGRAASWGMWHCAGVLRSSLLRGWESYQAFSIGRSFVWMRPLLRRRRGLDFVRFRLEWGQVLGRDSRPLAALGWLANGSNVGPSPSVPHSAWVAAFVAGC